MCACMRACVVYLNVPLSQSLCIFQVVKTGIAQGAQVGYEAEAAVSCSPTSARTVFKIVSNGEQYCQFNYVACLNILFYFLYLQFFIFFIGSLCKKFFWSH